MFENIQNSHILDLIMVGWNTKFRKHCKVFFLPRVHYPSQCASYEVHGEAQ